MKRTVCIHGHFYQPPRANPWTGVIDPQPSAAPFHDWNERVAAECYHPNSRAKQLDESGEVRRVANNYASISFNFGPTLLSWLEEFKPPTYRALLDADRMGAQQFSGHGPAMAQAFNHIILPLANRRDKQTQVIWGIRDFEHRFGRFPEGMWLPETAADLETLETLQEQGIRFTVLAPSQAARFRESSDGAWGDGDDLDPRRAYRVMLPSGGDLAVFFYDGPASRDIAFGGLLKQGERLAGRLASLLSENPKEAQLAAVATDGETYGHHKKFGEMALARALEVLQEDDGLALTVFGEFLEKHPPSWIAEIRENSSWSCAHGIERWQSDCGCSTGGPEGWNQVWRQPLRTAVVWLRDRLDSVFTAESGGIFKDPWAARDDYIDVLLQPESRGTFLAKHLIDPDKEHRALLLLAMEHQIMQAQTSCGWFFSDMAGIETVQILRHAGRALEHCHRIRGQNYEEEFLSLLARGKSNDPQGGTGRDIYLREVGKRLS